MVERVARAKFADPELVAKFVATSGRELIQGNTWLDTIWGCVWGKDGQWKGQNKLGKILMWAREEIAHGVSASKALVPAPLKVVLSTHRKPTVYSRQRLKWTRFSRG